MDKGFVGAAGEHMLEALNKAEVPKELFLGNIIGAFARALSDKMDQSVTDAVGMSTSASYTIVQIGSEPGSTIDELRKMLALEHSSLVRMLDRLEKMGLVARLRGTNGDKRSVSVSLTELGEECFTRIIDARSNVLSKLVQKLTLEEQENMKLLVDKLTPEVVDLGDDQHYVCRLCNLEACPQDICPVNLAHPGNEDHPERHFRRSEKHTCLGNLS